MPALGDLFVKIGADLKGLNNLGRRISSRLEPVRQQLNSIGGALSVSLSAPLLLAGNRAFDAAVKFDSLKRGLAAVAGSSAEAQAQLARLREVAKLPGLGLDQAIQGSTNLQAAGFSAKEAEAALASFGNALATVGRGASDLNDVSRSLTQIISKGKISAEEIGEIAQRVPQVRKAMQAAFGTAVAEDIQKRGIEARDFVNGLVAELGKLPRVSGGIANTLENASQSINDAFVSIGNAIIPIVDDILQAVVPVIERLAAAFSALSPSVQRNSILFAGLAAAIGPIALAISALISPVGLVVAGIAALAASTVAVIRNWNRIGPFFGRLFSNIGALISASVQGTLAQIRQFVDKAVNFFSDGIGRLVQGYSNIAENLGFDGLADSLGKASDKLKNFVTDEDIQANEQRLNELRDKFFDAFDEIQAQGFETKANLVAAFADIVKDIKDGFTSAGSLGLPEPEITPQSSGERLAGVSGAGVQDPGSNNPFEIVNDSLVRLLDNYTFKTALATSETERFRQELVDTFKLGDELAPILAQSLASVSDAIGEAALLVKIDFREGIIDAGEAVRAFGDIFDIILKRVISQLISATVRVGIFKTAFNALLPGSGFFSKGGFLGNVFSALAGRQFGGPVRQGVPYIVGETQPEIFIPNQSGRIVPFNQLRSSASIRGGGSIPSSGRPQQSFVRPIPLEATVVDVPGDIVRFKIQVAERNSKRLRGV